MKPTIATIRALLVDIRALDKDSKEDLCFACNKTPDNPELTPADQAYERRVLDSIVKMTRRIGPPPR